MSSLISHSWLFPSARVATALLQESGCREPRNTIRLFGHQVTVREVSGESLKAVATSLEEVVSVKEGVMDMMEVPKESLKEVVKKCQDKC